MYSLELQSAKQQSLQVTFFLQDQTSWCLQLHATSNATQRKKCYIVECSLHCGMQLFSKLFLPTQVSEQATSTSQWTPDSFGCSACDQLLYNPVVLNCGHAVCQPTCRPWVNGTAEPACPRCKATIIGHPSICTQVQYAPLPAYHA